MIKQNQHIVTTSKLARDGARVIKVERTQGDFARKYDNFAKGASSYFTWLNRDKESLVADLSSKKDIELLKRISSKADIVVQNLRPGVLSKHGVSLETLRKENPSLITLDITGYPTSTASNAYNSYKAYDLLVAAEAGLCSITGSKEAPGRVGISVCDILCGLDGYSTLLKGIIQRSISGKGMGFQTSLFGSVAEMMNVPLLQYKSTGKNPPRLGLNHPSIAPYGVFSSKDGIQILISIQNEQEWHSLCKNILGINPQTPEYSTPARRVKNREDLNEIIQKTFSSLIGSVLIQQLTQSNIAFGELKDMEGLLKHPALNIERAMNEFGDLVDLISNSSLEVNEASNCEFISKVPRLGEHTLQIQKEFIQYKLF